MQPLELSKQIVKNTARKSWDVATVPWRVSLNSLNALGDLLEDNAEYQEPRKQIAEKLAALHELLRQSNEKVEYRLAGETEVYSIKLNDGRKIILYFRKQLIGYKASVEEQVHRNYQILEQQEVKDYQKLESILYGPLFLAEHLGTIRIYQHASRIGNNQEMSQRQMANLIALLDSVTSEVSKK